MRKPLVSSTRRGGERRPRVGSSSAQEIGAERMRELNQVVDAGVVAHNASKIGTTVRALINGPSKKDRTKLAARSQSTT